MKVAGQKAKTLARLNRRTRKNNPLNRAALKRGNRRRDREIGFARAGGSRKKNEMTAAQSVKGERLSATARRDAAASGAQSRAVNARQGGGVVVAVAVIGVIGILENKTRRGFHFGGADFKSVVRAAIKRLEGARRRVLRARRPEQGEMSAARSDFDAKKFAEAREIVAVRTEQQRRHSVVLKIKPERSVVHRASKPVSREA